MKKINYLFELITFFVISLLYIFPFFVVKIGYVKIFYIILGLVFIYSYVKKLLYPFLMIFLIGLLIATILAYNSNTALFSALGSNLCFLELLFLPVILMLGVYKLNDKKTTNILFYGILIITLIPFINSYNAYSLDNNLSRTLTAVSHLEAGVLNENFLQNIGSFNFVYSMGIIFLLVFFEFINKIQYRIINAIILVFLIIFFFNAGFSILFINLTISSFLMCILKYKKNIFITFSLLVVLFILVLCIKDILILLNNTIDNPIFNYKLNLLINTSNQDTFDNINRLRLYRDAFLEFLSSPLIGCQDNQIFFISHTTLIALLGRTGLIGFSLYIYLYYFNFNLLLKYFSKDIFIDLVLPIIVFVGLCGLLNPTDTLIQFGLYLFLLVPLYILKVKNETNIEMDVIKGEYNDKMAL